MEKTLARRTSKARDDSDSKNTAAGIMGYWNNGVLEYWVLKLLIELDCFPLLIPNIPILQHAIILVGMYGRLHPFGVAPKPGPLGTDSSLLVEGKSCHGNKKNTGNLSHRIVGAVFGDQA